jgi:hypothetical protein
VGIKLHNKLPNKLKNLEKLQNLKESWNIFLLQHIFYSVGEYMSYWIFYQLFITFHILLS